VGVVDDAIGCDGDICGCCALVASFALVDDNRRASSMLCLTNGGITLSAGSDKRSAMSAGRSGRISSECDVDELGDMEMLLPRGLLERREGVSGGLPGNEGAHTICSGVTEESPLTDLFSLPSIIVSNSIRKCSAEIADESDRLRSREFDAGDMRRIERSNGVVAASRLLDKMNGEREKVVFYCFCAISTIFNSLIVY
jgi:hypothetical protein